jgi:hypothetical protein
MMRRYVFLATSASDRADDYQAGSGEAKLDVEIMRPRMAASYQRLSEEARDVVSLSFSPSYDLPSLLAD